MWNTSDAGFVRGGDGVFVRPPPGDGPFINENIRPEETACSPQHAHNSPWLPIMCIKSRSVRSRRVSCSLVTVRVYCRKSRRYSTHTLGRFFWFSGSYLFVRVSPRAPRPRSRQWLPGARCALRTYIHAGGGTFEFTLLCSEKTARTRGENPPPPFFDRWEKKPANAEINAFFFLFLARQENKRLARAKRLARKKKLHPKRSIETRCSIDVWNTGPKTIRTGKSLETRCKFGRKFKSDRVT